MKTLAALSFSLVSIVASFFAVTYLISYMGVTWAARSWVVTVPGIASINLSPAWTVFPIFLAGWFLSFLFGCGVGITLKGKSKHTSDALPMK